MNTISTFIQKTVSQRISSWRKNKGGEKSIIFRLYDLLWKKDIPVSMTCLGEEDFWFF
jgi:hypothetical protein